MSGVLAIIAANLRRMRSDKSNIFFVILLPLLIVLALSLAFGGASEVRLGVVDPINDATTREVHDAVATTENVTVKEVADLQDLRSQIARNILDGGWHVTREGTGDAATTTIVWVTGTTGGDFPLRSVAEATANVASLRAQAGAIVQRTAEVTRAAADGAVERAATSGPQITVATETLHQEDEDDRSTIRSALASSQLTLFIFLTSLMGASALVTSRQYGVTRRTSAAPITQGQIILGEAISRFLVAMIQAVVIILGSALLFGVDWQNPGAVIILSAALSVVGTGLAMLLGTVARGEQQVVAIGLIAGLGLAALGGSMQPLEFFPDAMRTVAFCVTPHAWMNDALWRILVDGDGISVIWPAVGVLVALGLVLIAIASRLLARRLRA